MRVLFRALGIVFALVGIVLSLVQLMTGKSELGFVAIPLLFIARFFNRLARAAGESQAD